MKKGFTLIELIAVILILGIITGIAIYEIANRTNVANIETIKESAREIIKAADNYYADLGYTNFPINGIEVSDLEFKSNSFKSGKVKLVNDEYVVVNLTDGKYCVNGSKNNLVVEKSNCD